MSCDCGFWLEKSYARLRFLLSLSSVFPPAVGSGLTTAAGPAFFLPSAFRHRDNGTDGP